MTRTLDLLQEASSRWFCYAVHSGSLREPATAERDPRRLRFEEDDSETICLNLGLRNFLATKYHFKEKNLHCHGRCVAVVRSPKRWKGVDKSIRRSCSFKKNNADTVIKRASHYVSSRLRLEYIARNVVKEKMYDLQCNISQKKRVLNTLIVFLGPYRRPY